MRFLQNIGAYSQFQRELAEKVGSRSSYDEHLSSYIKSGYGAPHILKPIYMNENNSVLTVGNDHRLQKRWLLEQGKFKSQVKQQTLLEQIEEFKPDIFYNLDPINYDANFPNKLPSCVKASFAWIAAPNRNFDFSYYEAVLTNFKNIKDMFSIKPRSIREFSPSYDQLMGKFAGNTNQTSDVIFVGSYSRYHKNRIWFLNSLTEQLEEFSTVYYLNRGISARATEKIIELLPLKSKNFLSRKSVKITREPIFGTDLYCALSSAKIVVNLAIDFAGEYRGNMRCFETLGCGALLLTDAGIYPKHMIDGETMVTYNDPADAISRIRYLLGDDEMRAKIASAGHHMISTKYSKENQFKQFSDIISES